MLEELTWVPLSKKRENARLILFYKIIKNLAMENHNLKFRHIGYNVDPYGQSFFPKCISAWNGLAQEIAEANTLTLFTECQSQIIQLHPDSTFCDISIKN